MKQKECKIIISYDELVVTPEKLLEAEIFLNNEITNIIFAKFGIAIRIHL